MREPYVKVSAPSFEARWWDRPALHIFWSYASWATLILAAFGWKSPRKLFSKLSRRS